VAQEAQDLVQLQMNCLKMVKVVLVVLLQQVIILWMLDYMVVVVADLMSLQQTI